MEATHLQKTPCEQQQNNDNGNITKCNDSNDEVAGINAVGVHKRAVGGANKQSTIYLAGANSKP